MEVEEKGAWQHKRQQSNDTISVSQGMESVPASALQQLRLDLRGCSSSSLLPPVPHSPSSRIPSYTFLLCFSPLCTHLRCFPSVSEGGAQSTAGAATVEGQRQAAAGKGAREATTNTTTE
jgi:hypothetical protein